MNTQSSVRSWLPAVALAVAMVAVLAIFGSAKAAWAAEMLQKGSVAADSPGLTSGDKTSSEHADGWEQVGSKWTYWLDGKQVKGEWIDTSVPPMDAKKVPAGKQRYWIDRKGALAVNRLIDPERFRDADPDAYYAYATKYGYVATGKYKVTGSKKSYVYLAKKKGDKLGQLETGNKYGILRTSAYDKVIRNYYIDPATHCAVVPTDRSQARPVNVKGMGWVLPYHKEGFLLSNDKMKIGNRVYLAKPNGFLETGNVKVGGKLTDILKTKSYDNGALRYYYINPKTHSAVVKSKAVKVPHYGWVLPCNKGGFLAVGRKVIGKQVFLAREDGRLETGNKRGILLSSDYSKDGSHQRYYINPKTHAITYGKPVKVKGIGLVYAPNKWGNLMCGVTKVDDKHVVLATNGGVICNEKGWVRTSAYAGSEQLYYMQPTAMNKKVLGARTGYFKVDGSLYYANSDGSVIRNQWHKRGNKYYAVTDDGVMHYDSVVTHLYREAQGYWSPSRYLLMVDIDDPRVLVLEGSQGNWNVKFIWDCCTGAPSTPTCEGTFAVGDKGYSFGEGNGYSCYYWTQIYGGYLFHTRLYYAYTWDLMDPTIGERCSHGCVRMYTDDAKWIWDNVPSGTTVACIY